MENQSMTALVCAFARAYHSRNNKVKIFDDSMAEKILTEEEYDQVSASMSRGISFFNPNFVGSEAEALRFIVDRFLAPSPVGRAAYAERMLENAVKRGASQYLIFAAGLDTFANRQPDWAKNLKIFEIDHPSMSVWKQSRVQKLTEDTNPNLHFIAADFSQENWQEALSNSPDFRMEESSFCSLLGISYYLTKEQFVKMIAAIRDLVSKGSSIVFDYPVQDAEPDKAGEPGKKLSMMAGAAGEKMLSSYSYDEMERLLMDGSFLIREHLTPEDITKRYFAAYNVANKNHLMAAEDHVNYCLAEFM